MNEADTLYQLLTENSNTDAFIGEMSDKALTLFSKKGHLDGIHFIVDFFNRNRALLPIKNNAIIHALNFPDKATSIAMIAALACLYDVKASTYWAVAITAIKLGSIYRLKIILSYADLDLKNACLSEIIRLSSDSDRAEGKDLLKCFEACIEYGAQDNHTDFMLYTKALQLKSTTFITYYAQKYPHMVKTKESLFKGLCLSDSTSNKQIKILLNAGASLNILTQENWIKILNNHHKIYTPEGVDNDRSLLTLWSDEFSTIQTPYLAANLFSENVLTQMDINNCNPVSEFNTLLWLLKEDRVDAPKIAKTLQRIYKNNDTLPLLWEQFLTGHPIKSAMACLLAYRTDLLTEFSSLCDKNENHTKVFIKVLKSVAGVNPIELISAFSEQQHIVMAELFEGF